MIEYLCIFLVAATQISLYLWMDKTSFKLNKLLLLLGLLLAQIFIFPKIALVVYNLNDKECGMPIVGLHLFFLILGGGLNLITHITYYGINRKKIKQKL